MLSVHLLIIHRFIGVKDISAVRLSLPAQLLEPVGNLEYEFHLIRVLNNRRYWNYLDRPDYFIRSGGLRRRTDLVVLVSLKILWIECWRVYKSYLRLILVIRFWYTKDLKFVVCALFYSLLTF